LFSSLFFLLFLSSSISCQSLLINFSFIFFSHFHSFSSSSSS
jgi:hypothetical protein